MRQRLVTAIVVGGCLIVGVGLVTWAGAKGLLSPQGKGNRLLSLAQQDMRQGRPAEAQVKLQQFLETFSASPLADEALLSLGAVHEQQQQLVEARASYRMLLERFPDSPMAEEAQNRLGAINTSLLFSPALTEQDVAYEVKAGDTLGTIAVAHRTTVELIKRANGLTNDVIRPKQKLKIPRGQFSIIVDKSDNLLWLSTDNQFFKRYHVSTGKDNSTPVGTFKIVNKLMNPTWYKAGAAVPPESPENILGTRWLGFDKPSYGIHGTTEPDAIGQQVTAGCVRMTNAEVEELFAIVPVGTEVTITD